MSILSANEYPRKELVDSGATSKHPRGFVRQVRQHAVAATLGECACACECGDEGGHEGERDRARGFCASMVRLIGLFVCVLLSLSPCVCLVLFVLQCEAVLPLTPCLPVPFAIRCARDWKTVS